MNKVHIKIINNSPFPTPTYATLMSAGCDIRANIEKDIIIPSGGCAIIDTGLKIALPDGYEAQVRGRSGLNFNCSIVVAVGTIDADYRGEIRVKMYNLSQDNYAVQPADRIAQLIIAPVAQALFEVVDTLDDTERGEGGFGSTGKN